MKSISLNRAPNFQVCLSLTLVLLAVGPAGCSRESNTTPPTFAKLPDKDSLRDRIDTDVDNTLSNRTLSTSTHNAWQIMHGILPYGKALRIDRDGQLTPALQWLLDGGKLNGWDLMPGDKGVIAVLAPGSRAAQGHPDQWVGILSQGGEDGIHGLKLDEPLVVDGKTYTIEDLLKQGEWDVFPGMESPWLIWAMTAYRPLDYKWTSKDGEEWTFERLVGMDAGLPVVGELASCGGTHRLYGLTIATNRYMKETGTPPDKLTGGWKKAYEVVQDCVRKTQDFQQPDGNFSTLFFLRPAKSPDVETTLFADGHTLEWLDKALTDQQIQQPWMTAAVNRLSQLLEDNSDRPLDCGALYHAMRGLRLYRDRRFGTHDIVSAVSGTGPDKIQSSGNNDDSAPTPPPGKSYEKNLHA